MKTLGFIYAILAAVTWGMVYVIDQKVLTKFSPLSFLFVSSLFTLIITLPILLFDWSSVKTILSTDRTNFLLVLASVVLVALAIFFIFSGIKILGANTASIFEISYPFFVTLFSFIVFGTRFNMYFFVGSILMFLGSLIIIKLG